VTEVARRQFEVDGFVVRHLPTGARFTRGSNLIQWGKAGDRLPNGEEYARKDVMRAALRILDEVAGPQRRGPRPRRLQRRENPPPVEQADADAGTGAVAAARTTQRAATSPLFRAVKVLLYVAAIVLLTVEIWTEIQALAESAAPPGGFLGWLGLYLVL
jgi:hypothetical protein